MGTPLTLPAHRPPVLCLHPTAQSSSLPSPKATSTPDPSRHEILGACQAPGCMQPRPSRTQCWATALPREQETYCDSASFCRSARMVPPSWWTSSVSPYWACEASREKAQQLTGLKCCFTKAAVLSFPF